MRFMLLLLVSSNVFARAQSEVPYSLAEAFSTAVRFVRVDKSCKVVDQDPNAAFVTFEYTDEGKLRKGSVEVWKTQKGASVQVTLGDEPHYMELRWVELIERKLKEERGTPTPIVRPSPAPPQP
jgi:hypothetical protein